MSKLTTHTIRGIPSTLDQVTLSAGHEFINDGVVDLTKNHGAFQLPTGTTGQRPTSPAAGYIRWNTSQDENGIVIGVEYYDGSNWYKYGDRDPATIAEEEEYDAANPVDGGDVKDGDVEEEVVDVEGVPRQLKPVSSHPQVQHVICGQEPPDPVGGSDEEGGELEGLDRRRYLGLFIKSTKQSVLVWICI